MKEIKSQDLKKIEIMIVPFIIGLAGGHKFNEMIMIYIIFVIINILLFYKPIKRI